MGTGMYEFIPGKWNGSKWVTIFEKTVKFDKCSSKWKLGKLMEKKGTCKMGSPPVASRHGNWETNGEKRGHVKWGRRLSLLASYWEFSRLTARCREHSIAAAATAVVTKQLRLCSSTRTRRDTKGTISTRAQTAIAMGDKQARVHAQGNAVVAALRLLLVTVFCSAYNSIEVARIISRISSYFRLLGAPPKLMDLGGSKYF